MESRPRMLPLQSAAEESTAERSAKAFAMNSSDVQRPLYCADRTFLRKVRICSCSSILPTAEKLVNPDLQLHSLPIHISFHAELTLLQPFAFEDRIPYQHWGGTNHWVREPAPETGFGLSTPDSGSQPSLPSSATACPFHSDQNSSHDPRKTKSSPGGLYRGESVEGTLLKVITMHKRASNGAAA